MIQFQWLYDLLGEALVSRTRPIVPVGADYQTDSGPVSLRSRDWALIWAASFGAHFSILSAQGVSLWAWVIAFDGQRHPVSDAIRSVLALAITASIATPFVIWFVFRFPIESKRWRSRVFLHFLGAVFLTAVHVVIDDPIDPMWDPKLGRHLHIVTLSSGHGLIFHGGLFGKLILLNFGSDFVVYLLSGIVGHAILYYLRIRDREIRSAQLETQLATARLQTLKSQLRPHFLFNTLHSISALMLSDAPAADRMMARLGDLLRLSLEDTDLQLTTVKREFEFVSVYLEIEKMRFAERLTYSVSMDPETLSAAVPHLLIQPLVENAVRHGIGEAPTGGHIGVSVSGQGGLLVIQVQDNGPGIDSSIAVHGLGLGLKTTQARLQTLYKDRQTFRIESSARGGTLVRVEIPFEVLAESHPRDTLDRAVWSDRNPGILGRISV